MMIEMAGSFGNGGTLKIGTTTVSELTSVAAPNYSADTIDTTTHNCTDKFRTFVKGLIDAGEIPVEGNFSYTEYAVVYAAMVTTTQQSIAITIPTSPSVTTFACNGYVTGLECDDPHDDKVSFTATCKISGKPVLTVA
jgi:predicted secreted protein